MWSLLLRPDCVTKKVKKNSSNQQLESLWAFCSRIFDIWCFFIQFNLCFWTLHFWKWHFFSHLAAFSSKSFWWWQDLMNFVRRWRTRSTVHNEKGFQLWNECKIWRKDVLFVRKKFTRNDKLSLPVRIFVLIFGLWSSDKRDKFQAEGQIFERKFTLNGWLNWNWLIENQWNNFKLLIEMINFQKSSDFSYELTGSLNGPIWISRRSRENIWWRRTLIFNVIDTLMARVNQP